MIKFNKRKSLSDRTKAEAISLGLCQKWTEEWKNNSSKDEMVDKFVRGIDFCIEHNWPSTEVMKKDFGDVIHNHGVYVDEQRTLFNPSGVIILNGECEFTIICNEYSSCDIYIRHTSRLRLIATDNARISLNMYNDSNVIVSSRKYAKVFVYKYGGDFKNTGAVIVRDRTNLVSQP